MEKNKDKYKLSQVFKIYFTVFEEKKITHNLFFVDKNKQLLWLYVYSGKFLFCVWILLTLIYKWCKKPNKYVLNKAECNSFRFGSISCQ